MVTRSFMMTVKRGFNSHLQCFITATNVRLVDKDIGNGLLPGHLQQHVLVIGSIIWTEG